MHIEKLINQAIEYTESYAKKYNVTDKESLKAIFNTHLAHLINTL